LLIEYHKITFTNINLQNQRNPWREKIIKKDTFTAFAWVGDLRGLNFYSKSKDQQKEAMTKHGIMIDKLETHGNERLEKGIKFMVKSLKRLS
jgi:hypothetical protein